MRKVKIEASETGAVKFIEIEQALIDQIKIDMESELGAVDNAQALLDKTTLEVLQTLDAKQMQIILNEMQELKEELATTNIEFKRTVFEQLRTTIMFSIIDYIEGVAV